MILRKIFKKTREIIELAHSQGISVEAEVGAIGGEEDGVVGGGEVADPEECKQIADLALTCWQPVLVTFMAYILKTGRA